MSIFVSAKKKAKPQSSGILQALNIRSRVVLIKKRRDRALKGKNFCKRMNRDFWERRLAEKEDQVAAQRRLRRRCRSCS